MKLQEYLDRNNKKVSDLAGDLNLRHTVVLRWGKRDKRYPRPESNAKNFLNIPMVQLRRMIFLISPTTMNLRIRMKVRRRNEKDN